MQCDRKPSDDATDSTNSACPPIVAEILEECGINPQDWADDWVDLLVMFSEIEAHQQQ